MAQKIIVRGGRPLKGRVRVSGAKNAALAILCGAILAEESIVLDNIPNISDVQHIIQAITYLGARVVWRKDDALSVSVSALKSRKAPYELVKKLRASNLLLGPVLARCGEVRIPLPGGCNIGIRPMDLHFKGLSALGAQVTIERGYIWARAPRLYGAQIYLDFPSVGATENIMMAACLAEGQTLIENAAKEPEVVDLANFLNGIGARIFGAGTDVIRIEGVKELGRRIHYSVIPDRIEAGTFMVAAAATGGKVKIEGVIPRHIQPLTAKLREIGVEVVEGEDVLCVKRTQELRPVNIKTMPYPGFPTDMQSQVIALLTVASGTSVVVENIYENRFQVAQELRRMGAKIKVEGRAAIVEGVPQLCGAQVRATDLRAGAALVIAGLIAEEETEVNGAELIYRGYKDFERKLAGLGADIRTFTVAGEKDVAGKEKK
ncbi:MAG: UDP-N-acetylglucosamine 1-carboxyvinyltransferase [Bacillota bacterium]|nr:UDP-N-acetylglucosamine 1-carboxyvinyltransferase [Thermoanaerobacteraceae bacterium]